MFTKNDLPISVRLDSLLSERNLKQKTLCEHIQISSSAISSLRKNNGMLAADTALKIADFFKVDPKWLITGSIDLPENMKAWPQAIFDRVYQMLLTETGIQNPDYHDVSFEQQEKIWAPIAGIVSRYDLFNWQFNRIMPSYKQIEALAKYFKKPLYYIAEGIDNSIPDYIETYKVSKDDYDYYKNYEKHKTLFWSYDAMYEPDKKYIAYLIKRLFRLRRTVENRDYDLDYNRAHPLEEPRQKDPNISDEEYDEIYKDSRKGL